MTNHDTKICKQCGKEFGPGRWKQNWKHKKFCGMQCSKDYIRAGGPARFWAKVDKSAGPLGCWLYTGFRKWDGYGWVARSQGNSKIKWMTAHRYAWILTHGEPQAGLQILHNCDNPPCCNPAHLRLGTIQDNAADKVGRKRHAFGERSGRKRLTFEQVVEMRKLVAEGWSYKDLGLKFGCRKETAYHAATGRTWKTLEPAQILHPGRVRPRRQSEI